MDEKFKKLIELGAGEVNHIDGVLIDHLFGTQELLKEWNASGTLQKAGLYHATYGTSGFNSILISDEKRDEVAQIIGNEAEEIVYLYCACDRDYFWPQIGAVVEPQYKNRFTGHLSVLNKQQLCDFCELTVANELEIAIDNSPFLNKYGKELYSVFINMRDYLSKPANNSVELVLGNFIRSQNKRRHN